MKFVNGKNCFGSNSSQCDMNRFNKHECFTGRNFRNSSVMFYLFIFVIAIFISSESAIAQSGYLVQPHQINLGVKPRERFVGELKLHNFDPNEIITVSLKVIELTQSPNGEWLPFDTDPCSPFDYNPLLDLSKVSSCSSWITLDKTEVNVPADGDAVVGIIINTPSRARSGFYGATVMTSTMTKASAAEKVPMIVRSGIPVIANVQVAANTIPKVEIKDIGMEFVPSEGAFQGKVFLNMKITNEGKVFPRLKPIIRVRGFLNGHWQLITTHEFDEIGIIPGVELDLKSDLGKSLPSGKYELESVLYVNGSLRGKNLRLNKEIQFKGDPMITKIASDVPLDVNPAEIIIPMRPGTTREGSAKAYSAVIDKIQIQPILDIPKAFKDIATTQGLIAEELSCLKWLTVTPGNFFLENYQGRNITVSAKMPENALKYPNYYASLGLKTSYLDGQSAGTTWFNICLENPDMKIEPKIICSAINFEEYNISKSEYYVQAAFQNIGQTHIFPSRVRAAAVKADGFGRTAALLNCDKYGMFMPYETRYYKGILNFSSVAVDDYNLEVLMNYPPDGAVKRQIRLRVKEVGKRKIPEIIDKNVDSTELMPVNWE
ncbi:MAG: hypothetical protein JW787_05350 [Sedimentisphaerales bacterium]|nr:hypothetical protein [Sedimentisphaerales bacterium]